MADRLISFAPGAAGERVAFTAGPPIACATDSEPFALAQGSAELYLRQSGAQTFLGELGEGDAVFALSPEGAQFLLVPRGEIAFAALAPAQRDLAFTAWRERLSAVEGEFADPLTLSAALVAAIERRAAARDAEAVARLGSAAPGDDAGAQHAPTLGELLGVAARELKAPQAAIAPGDRLRDISLTPARARSAGLAARKVMLPRDWRDHDQGPLILRQIETGQLACALWRSRSYALANGAPLDGEDAPTFERTAYAIYAPLPDGITGLWGLARHVLAGNFFELRTIALTATLMALLGVLVPLVTGWILSDIAPSGDAGMLLAVGIALSFAAAMTYLLSVLRGMATSRLQGKTGSRLAASVADRVLRMPASFFRELSAGDLNQRMAGLDGIRELVLSTALTAGLSAILSLFYFALLAWYGLGLALISLALVSVYIAIIAVTRVFQVPLIRKAYEIDGQLAEQGFEMIAGVAKLRIAASERRMLARWNATYREERALEYRAGVIASLSAALTDSWQVVTQVALFAGVANLAQASLGPGNFIAFLVAFGSFQGALVSLSSQMIALYAAQPQIDRARPIFEGAAQFSQGKSDPGRLEGAIELRDVSFGYSDSLPPVLSGVSLSVRPGEHMALVGGSGSGKSTLLRLLLGFEVPQRGSILFDGKDMAQLDQTLVRSQIGVVLQSSSLFAGSIIENIRGSNDADLEECLAAGARAGLADDLETFPMGIHTMVTEGAAVLSGGQRQRILIARSLVANPGILFFDEATSALDNQSQAVVAQTLDAMAATRVTIAHRLSTIANADRICVLKDGRIAEQGRYDELIRANGVFAALARRQLMEDE